MIILSLARPCLWATTSFHELSRHACVQLCLRAPTRVLASRASRRTSQFSTARSLCSPWSSCSQSYRPRSGIL